MKIAFFENLTLQKKFILLTSVAVILLMATIGFMVTRRESRIMYSDIERQGMLLAETLAIPVINDLIYERLGLVEEGGLIDNYITEIFKRKEINLVYIAILDERGRVISHNDFNEYGKTYNDSVTVRALMSDSSLVQRFYNEAIGHDVLDFATPLSIGKKRWGTLKFAVSLEAVEKEIKATVINVIVLTLILLFGGFGIILILSRRFIRPIIDLAHTMEKAGGDTLDVRADTKGNDELALLGQSFNRMIDRIREANLEINRTHDKLLQSEKLASIGILASGVAHEINNPLGGIFNCVQMLEQMGESEKFRRRYLELLKDGLNKIESTVGKLLWMSRKDDREPCLVNIGETLKDIQSLIEYNIKSRGITFVEEISSGLSVMIDPHDLYQVIMNLVINAIQSMNGGGRLSVRGYTEDSCVVIEVSDSGEGIEERDIGKIFDPFYTTKQPGEGTGLGLWLTYEIVKNYNAEIIVKSRRGEGSTFRLKFKGAASDEAQNTDN